MEEDNGILSTLATPEEQEADLTRRSEVERSTDNANWAVAHDRAEQGRDQGDLQVTAPQMGAVGNIPPAAASNTAGTDAENGAKGAVNTIRQAQTPPNTSEGLQDLTSLYLLEPLWCQLLSRTTGQKSIDQTDTVLHQTPMGKHAQKIQERRPSPDLGNKMIPHAPTTRREDTYRFTTGLGPPKDRDTCRL